jgi:hypothetical protein
VSQMERENGGLLGVNWRMVGMRDDFGAFLPVLGDAVITAFFDEEGRVSGSSGCNRYTGPFTMLGDELGIGAVAGTRMMCSDSQVMAQESRYLGHLSQVGSYRLVTGAEGWRAEFLDTDGMLILEYVEVL